jgi:hypothetical protein
MFLFPSRFKSWQVLEWLTLASAELSGSISDEKLSKLNAALASRTFLAGGAGPSLADLVLFGLLHPAAVRLMLPDRAVY